MSEVITPNMGLVEPAIGNTFSPDYASEQNANWGILDSHNHAAGSGVQITPSGLNINVDLPFGSNNATGLRSTRYSQQSAVLSGGSDAMCAYAVGTAGDLYWNDNNGNNIQITASGGVAGSPGSISGLASPAAATWVAATGSFVWTRSSSVGANMDAATLVVRYPGSYPSPSGNYIAIQAPSALASGFALTLPTTLPGARSFLTLDNSGNIATGVAYSAGLTTSNLSATAGILKSQQAAVGQQLSLACGTFTTSSTSFTPITNLTVTITTSGRPVMVIMQPDNTAGFANYAGSGDYSLSIVRDVLVIAQFEYGPTTTYAIGPFTLDMPGAGTYTYTVQSKLSSGTLQVKHYVLVAYEL